VSEWLMAREDPQSGEFRSIEPARSRIMRFLRHRSVTLFTSIQSCGYIAGAAFAGLTLEVF
jgi:hypothetical protein